MSHIYVRRDDLRKWQVSTLKMQQDFQDLLNQGKIQNWCGGGTLIGAVREGGFLYWDNDLDMFITTKDINRILLKFRESSFLDKYDLYIHPNGFWQKAENLTQVLKSKELDQSCFEYESLPLKKGMFKIFSKKGVAIKFYKNIKENIEEYVKINHYAREHLTRYRLASKNDRIKDGHSYSVLPNICVIPMLEMKYSQYIVSILNYALGSLFKVAGNKLINLFEDSIYKKNIYEDDKILRLGEVTDFDPHPLGTFSSKSTLATKIFLLALYNFLKTSIKSRNKDFGDRYIAYQLRYFRLIVLPFHFSDIFPTKLIKFEDTYISAPNNPEAVLRVQFGDFETVPPESDRVGWPFFIEGRM